MVTLLLLSIFQSIYSMIWILAFQVMLATDNKQVKEIGKGNLGTLTSVWGRELPHSTEVAFLLLNLTFRVQILVFQMKLRVQFLEKMLFSNVDSITLCTGGLYEGVSRNNDKLGQFSASLASLQVGDKWKFI